VSPRARIVLWFLSTVTFVVLLFGYQTSTSGPTALGTQKAISAGSGQEAGSAAAGGAPATGAPATGSAAAAPPATGTTQTVTGQVADTRWGPVQVQLTVSGHRITDVAVVQYPNGNRRDQEINSQALPILVQETIAAQNANIDMVGGATVTSDGYLRSLQSALDKAGL
jgi:uncharacterized protein with FMN-binding domain